MNRVDKLLADSGVKELFFRMDELEKDRIYCKHGIEHALDVARIGYLMILEKQLPIEKELFYVTAILHDLGRVAQYENGASHHEAGVEVAKEILGRLDFSQDEIGLITSAIATHRHGPQEPSYQLAFVLYKADKLSRNCFCCQAVDTCYWKEDARNASILY